jgi:hypothetical protein
MSDSLGFVLAIIFAEIVPAAIYLYAAHWAFAVRRALVSRIYRSHALWLGALGVMLAVTMFITYSGNTTRLLVVGTYNSILFAVVFAFADSIVPVARRSDPLLRSILRWGKLRIALWAVVVPMVLTNTIPILGPSFANSPAGNIVVNIGWYILATILFIFMAAALVTGARRSRDLVLRVSLKWLGVLLSLTVVRVLDAAMQTTVLGVSLSDYAYSYPALIGAALSILSAYALYRSARSLAPINRLPSIEPQTIPPSDAAKT